MSTIFRIRELRQRQGMTQAQLARKIGMKSASAITMWESGDRNPSSEILPHLADTLNCTIDALYKRDSPKQSDT